MDFDQLLKEVGDFGTYQIVLFFLICLPASLPSAFSAFNQPFVVGSPRHQCRQPDGFDELYSLVQHTPHNKSLDCYQFNETDLISLSSVPDENKLLKLSELKLIRCQNGWIYDNSTYINTIVIEYDLVCDQQYWIDLSSMTFYIGSFVGNILFGHIADKYGRRFSFFMILATLVICGTLNAFSWNVQSFVILRFLTGLPFPALFQIPFIISLELMGESGRIFSGILIDVFFGVAMTLLGVLAMFVRHWRKLIFISNAPFAILFLYHFILPESPRWLITVGRFSQAKDIMKRIAQVNDRKDVNVDSLISQMQKDSGNTGNTRNNLCDLFKTPNLRKKTILVTYIWFVNALVYNGLTFNIANLPVNDYVSFIINGAVELPAYFIVWPLLETIGRRWALVSAMLLAGIACASTMFIPEPGEHPWIIAGLAYMGKFGIAGSFAVIYIFAGELYPTVVRAVGMGMSSMVAGLGLILGPHLVRLGDTVKILPLLIMGVLSVTASVTSFFLPETLGTSIPQTIEQAEQYGKNQPFTCFPSIAL